MNDVSNRAVREFSEFLNIIEADFPKEELLCKTKNV